MQGLAVGAVGAGALALGGCGGTPQTNSSAVVSELNPQDYDYTSNSIDDFSKTTLFSDWQLGPITLHHRMVKSAAFQLAFMKNDPDEYINYYARMANGGVEMIWIEDFANIWDFTASPLKQDYALYDVKGLLDTLHAAGAYDGIAHRAARLHRELHRKVFNR